MLSLAPSAPQLNLGATTIVRETFANDGVSMVKGLKLTFRLADGWQLKRLGPARARRAGARPPVHGGLPVTAPLAGPPVTLAARVAGGATYDPPARRPEHAGDPRGAGVRAGAAAVRGREHDKPGATFGAGDGAFAISARGTGVLATA